MIYIGVLTSIKIMKLSGGIKRAWIEEGHQDWVTM